MLCTKKSQKRSTILLFVITLIITIVLFSCSSPTTPTTPTNPTNPTEPVVTNPTEPTIPDTPSVDVKNTAIYNTIKAVGITPETKAVVASEGQYQPKTGELLGFTYTRLDLGDDPCYKFKMDLDKYTEDKVVYDESLYDEAYDIEYRNEDLDVVIDKANKTLTIPNGGGGYEREFKFNDDGTIDYSHIWTDDNGDVTKKSTDNLTYNPETKSFISDFDNKEVLGNIKITLAE